MKLHISDFSTPSNLTGLYPFQSNFISINKCGLVGVGIWSVSYQICQDSPPNEGFILDFFRQASLAGLVIWELILFRSQHIDTMQPVHKFVFRD